MKKRLLLSGSSSGQSLSAALKRMSAVYLFLIISVSGFARVDGFGGTASIGDRLWLDANANGIQDATETTGIAGVIVQLKNAAGTVIATATTNSSGNYLFGALEAGTYTVAFPISTTAGSLTRPNLGGNDDADSDAGINTGVTDAIILTAGQKITHVDAGYYPRTMVLGGSVWSDLEKDAIKNTRTGGAIIFDRGISGVTVKLYLDADNNNIPDGAALRTTVTDSAGNYQFLNLSPSNYLTGVMMPTGFSGPVISGGDPDNNIDNDNNGITVTGGEIRANAISLTAGQEPTTDGDGANGNLTVDFGFDKLPFINNYLACCINDAGVISYGVNAKLVDETTTPYASYFSYAYQYKNSAGAWVCFTEGSNTINNKTIVVKNARGVGFNSVTALIFSTLDPSLQGLVVRCVFSLGQNSTACAMPAGNTFNSGSTSLNQVVDLSNAVCRVFGSIGDRVWNDNNRNGIQDNGEAGIADIPMELLNDAGTVVATTTTNGEGLYAFTNLLAGSYKVKTKPATLSYYTVTGMDIGGNDNIDNDFSPVSFTTGTLVLAQGQNRTDVDAGLYRTIQLTGNVWHDINGMTDNLVNNSGAANTPPAAAIPMVNVYLVNAASGLIERSTIVSTSGKYGFKNVTPNTNYFLYLTSSNLAVGSIPPPVPTILPLNWKHTGQKLGISPGSDGINDGKLAVPVYTTDVIDANFGIQLTGEVTGG